MAAPRGSFKSDLDGVEATLAIFKSNIQNVEPAMDSIMADIADGIRDKARDYAPESVLPENVGNPEFGPGYLKATAGVVRNGMMDYSIVFTAWYSLYVHELFMHHENGSWQFLSRAVAEMIPFMSQEVGENLRLRLSGVSAQGGSFTSFFGGLGGAGSAPTSEFGAIIRKVGP